MDSDKKINPNPTKSDNKAAVAIREEKKDNSCAKDNKQKVELIENLSIPEKDKLKLLSLVFTSSSFEGPLPPASQFQEYEDAVPGAGDRIIAMAEEINKASAKGIKTQNIVSIMQSIFGFLLATGILGITFHALNKGMKEGLWLVVAELAAMLGIFLGTKFSKK